MPFWKKNDNDELLAEEAITESNSSLASVGSKRGKKKFWKRKNKGDKDVEPFDSSEENNPEVANNNNNTNNSNSDADDEPSSEYDADIPTEKHDGFLRASTGRVSMDSIRIRMFELEQKYTAAMNAISETKEDNKGNGQDDGQDDNHVRGDGTSNASTTQSILKKTTRFAPDTKAEVRPAINKELSISHLMESPIDHESFVSASDDMESINKDEVEMRESTLNQSLKITDLGSSITANSLQYMSIMDGVQNPNSDSKSKSNSSSDSKSKSISIMGSVHDNSSHNNSGSDFHASQSLHTLSSTKGITKSFKVKKAFLGVKEEQKHASSSTSSPSIPGDDDGELNEDSIYTDAGEQVTAPSTLMLEMDPEFDAAFAPEDMRCLALVSHNNMKASMKQFVIANQNCLKKFRLTGTNTTMTMLKSVFGDDPEVVYGQSCASGPLGGDAQLVAMAVNGEIGGCIFFIDPMDAHPHGADIETLVRQGNVHNLVMLNNPSTAHVCLNALRLALKMGRMELFPSFFFDLESPSVPAYKKRQQAVLDRQIAEN